MVSTPTHDSISLDCGAFTFELQLAAWSATAWELAVSGQTVATEHAARVRGVSIKTLETMADLDRLARYLTHPMHDETFTTYGFAFQLTLTPDESNEWVDVELWINQGLELTEKRRVWLGFLGSCTREQLITFSKTLQHLLARLNRTGFVGGSES